MFNNTFPFFVSWETNLLDPLIQKDDVSMNTAGTIKILMNCLSDLSGVKKGSLEGGIGKEQSANGSASDEMPFLRMLKECFLSNANTTIHVRGKGYREDQKGNRLTDDTGKNSSTLKEENLNAFFSVPLELTQSRSDKDGSTIFLTENGVKENQVKLLLHHGLQKSDASENIFGEQNGRDMSVQDVKGLISNVMKGFEVGRSRSESDLFPGTVKQEIEDVLKGFGFSRKEIERFLSADKNEWKQNGLAVEETSDIVQDTGKKLFDGKTEKFSAAFNEVIKKFHESPSRNGNILSLVSDEKSDDVKKEITAMKNNSDEKIKNETINTETKLKVTMPKERLHGTIRALNAMDKDHSDDMGRKGHVLSEKESAGTNDTARYVVKKVTTQGQGNKGGNIKFVNENESKDSAITPMEEFHNEGRLMHRSGDGNHMTVSHSTMPSANASESRSVVAMNPRIVINQVADATGDKLTKGFGRIRIELNPPHLGTVDMDVLVRDSKVHVILQTENYDVKQLLQSNTEQLKTSLHTQGLTVDTISVSVQERSDGNHYEYGHNGTLYREMNDRRDDSDKQTGFHNSMGDASSSPTEGETTIGLDGRISLFA